jgi:hypothetical protein
MFYLTGAIIANNYLFLECLRFCIFVLLTTGQKAQILRILKSIRSFRNNKFLHIFHILTSQLTI